MNKFTALIALAGAVFAAQPALADFDMKAGPIWNNDDAKSKCPQACTLAWNGHWTTIVPGQMSICSAENTAADGKKYVIMDSTGGVEAGPIWNNGDAQTKCPAALAKVKWNGQWTTTVQGQMSVCGCTGNARPWQ